MLTLIVTDIKRRMKSPLTGFLILIILFMAATEIQSMDAERELRTFIHHDAYNFTQRSKFNYTLFVDDPEKNPKALRAAQLITEIQNEIDTAVECEDTEELLRLYTFMHLTYTRAGLGSHDPIMQMVLDKKMMPIWNDVANGMPYDSIESFWSIGNDGIDESRLAYEYYYHLFVNGIEPTYKDEANNATYLYAYFLNHLPKIILMSCILFIYNAINRQKHTGSLKLILTQSISRTRVYIAQFLSGSLHLIATLLIPPFLISFFIGWWQGFVPMNYPVTALSKGMTTLSSIPNFYDTINAQGRSPVIFYAFSHYAPKGPFADIMIPSGRMAWIPLSEFILNAVLLNVLFVLFVVAFTLLISTLIDHEIISFIVSAVLFGSILLLGLPNTQGLHVNFSPFNMGNASKIITGIANTTGLASVLILSLSTLVVLSFGLLHFRRKGI